MKGKPKIHRWQKVALWKELSDGKWHKAKDLSFTMSGTRIIRAICEAEPDKFISTQAGYKRTDLATDAELINARNDLMSRVKKMQARAQAIDDVLYRRQVPEQRRMVK